jgi:hypothetical protein
MPATRLEPVSGRVMADDLLLTRDFRVVAPGQRATIGTRGQISHACIVRHHAQVAFSAGLVAAVIVFAIPLARTA